jgi:hypothetical protein
MGALSAQVSVHNCGSQWREMHSRKKFVEKLIPRVAGPISRENERMINH